MKKPLFLILAFVVLSIANANAQLDNLVVKKFDTWSVGLHLSANNSNGDATDNKTMFNILSPKFGYGLTVSRQFSHFLSLEADYAGGLLGTEYSPYQFRSNFNQFTGRVRVNFTNGQILQNYKKTQFYGFVGVGMINFNTESVNQEGTISDWVHVIPFGIGYKKKVGERTSLNLELGYNSINSDKLDALKINGSEKDGYTDIRAGIQFTFGKKKKPLEWDEPLSYFKPLAEHSVDTVVIIKKEIVSHIDTTRKVVKELTIWYDTGDYLINGIYTQDVHSILSQLRSNRASWIEILAFCDSTGSETTNNKLVVKRSRIVNDFFVNEGIVQDRIHVYNYGMEFAKEEITSKDRKVVIRYWKDEYDKSRD
jgi:outer membrane protein OmpA-like peptidoglycan-associated protein